MFTSSNTPPAEPNATPPQPRSLLFNWLWVYEKVFPGALIHFRVNSVERVPVLMISA